MILSFNKRFTPKIKSGTKIHTIRSDPKNRWKPGRLIHFATGVRTKNYDNFKKDMCLSTQKIEFKYVMYDDKIPVVLIDRVVLATFEVERLAINDGFDTVQGLYDWFDSDFTGKIIHWTHKVY